MLKLKLSSAICTAHSLRSSTEFFTVNECDPEQLVCHCCYELFPRNLCVRCIPCREKNSGSLLTWSNNWVGRPDQIFAFQDREHLPFLCLHQPAKQIFFRTSRLQSEIFAPIQRKSMLAPPKMFAISRENQTFCTDDCIGCGMLSSLAADEKPSATATAKCTCSVNLGLESIEICRLLDIFMVLV